MIRLRYPKPAIFGASGVHPIFGNARVGLFTLVKYLSIDLVYHGLIHDQHLSAPKRKYSRFRMVNSSLINENTLGLSSGATGQIQIGGTGRPEEPVYDMERTLARRFSVDCNSEVTQTSSSSAQELKAFYEVFDQIVNALTKEVCQESELKKVFNRFAEVLRCNVPYGSYNFGLVVVESYRLLQPDATQHQLHLARILGWCMEMLQAYLVMVDDMVDKSITRRGLPCWYRKEGVGNVAINDSYFIRASVYRLLSLHFREEKYYVHLLDTFHEIELVTSVGQGLDVLTSQENNNTDLSAFTMGRYNTIVTWKTANWAYVPVALAMHLAGINDAESHEDCKIILFKIGYFFQVQNDYLDCYGDPNKTGKIGTDIQENKCTWLITRALMTANERQRRVLRENYGSCDVEKVARVKQIYTELNLKEQYQEFERESFLELTESIERSSGALPKTIYTKLAKKIYRREK